MAHKSTEEIVFSVKKRGGRYEKITEAWRGLRNNEMLEVSCNGNGDSLRCSIHNYLKRYHKPKSTYDKNRHVIQFWKD